MKALLIIGLMIFWVEVFAQGGGQGGQGDCQMTLTLTNAVVTPMSTGQVIQQNYTVRRASNNQNRCVFYRLYFGKGLANSYQRKAYRSPAITYDYNLHRATNLNGILKEFADAVNSNEYVRVAMPARNVDYTGSFFLYLPPSSSQNYPPAGAYTDNATVSLYREDNVGATSFQLSLPFTVTINMPVEINVSLVDQGGNFDPGSTMKTMNFGSLVQNSQQTTDLIVDSNTPYKVQVSSLRNGKMVSDGESLDYEFSFNGSPVNLTTSQTQPVQVITRTPVRGVKDRFPIVVKILSNPDLKPAGVYEDSITITATAN